MEPQKSSVGGIIGTIIIIAIIILGGLYFWGKRIEESKANQNLVSDESTTQQATTTDENADIENVSSADDLDSIDADLNSTTFTNLDAELQ